ncbi:MAG: Trm112 family protein [Hyphomonadaceae bacterium]|nr:Trm112 family protein [Hyphomonadaceae bacterium]
MTEPGEIKIDPMLLNALVCPKTRTPLVYDHDKNELVSKKAKLAYPVRECVPIMLIEEARDIGNKTG